MALADWMSKGQDLFNSLTGRKKTINSVSLEELDRERRSLGEEEQRLESEQSAVMQKESQLISEGREAQSTTQKTILARRVKEGRDRLKVVEQRRVFIAKSRKAIEGLYAIKENEQYFSGKGFGGILSEIPLSQVVAAIEKSPESMGSMMENMETILESLDEANGALADVGYDAGEESDPEMLEILSAMNPSPADDLDLKNDEPVSGFEGIDSTERLKSTREGGERDGAL